MSLFTNGNPLENPLATIVDLNTIFNKVQLSPVELFELTPPTIEAPLSTSETAERHRVVYEGYSTEYGTYYYVYFGGASQFFRLKIYPPAPGRENKICIIPAIYSWGYDSGDMDFTDSSQLDQQYIGSGEGKSWRQSAREWTFIASNGNDSDADGNIVKNLIMSAYGKETYKPSEAVTFKLGLQYYAS